MRQSGWYIVIYIAVILKYIAKFNILQNYIAVISYIAKILQILCRLLNCLFVVLFIYYVIFVVCCILLCFDIVLNIIHVYVNDKLKQQNNIEYYKTT